ncbi:UNVERIFIED_CONTAM: hypothetical protein FKN15_021745 [Acipenser sinensis]
MNPQEQQTDPLEQQTGTVATLAMAVPAPPVATVPDTPALAVVAGAILAASEVGLAPSVVAVGSTSSGSGCTDSQAQDVRAPPTQAQDVRAPPTQAQDVRAPPTQAQDVRAPPTQAQDVRAPPTQAQDVRAPPTQAQDVRAPPTQAQDVRAPPTQAQDVRAPPTQAQDVRAPPIAAPQFSTSQAVAYAQSMEVYSQSVIQGKLEGGIAGVVTEEKQVFEADWKISNCASCPVNSASPQFSTSQAVAYAQSMEVYSQSVIQGKLEGGIAGVVTEEKQVIMLGD